MRIFLILPSALIFGYTDTLCWWKSSTNVMADDTGIILTFFFCEQMENVYLQIAVMSDFMISKVTGLLLYVFLPVCCLVSVIGCLCSL